MNQTNSYTQCQNVLNVLHKWNPEFSLVEFPQYLAESGHGGQNEKQFPAVKVNNY